MYPLLMIKNFFRELRNWESIILICVLLQPVLTIIQIVLIDVAGYTEEGANKLRVIGVAVTMLPVILLSFKKHASYYFKWYVPFLFFLLLTIVRFPENTDAVLSNAFKFTIPFVLPSIIVISRLSSVEKLEAYMYAISWLQLLIMIYYCFLLFSGSLVFSGYNMSLSYALMLPTLALYSHEGLLSKFVSILLFLIMLALGSRGPVVVCLLYALFDIAYKNKKYIAWLSIFIVFGSSIIVALSSYLESLGVTSRFLYLLQSDEGVLGHTSGREDIYGYWLDKLSDNYLLGMGLFCDRQPNTPFFHNVLLEIALNYGVILGTILIICFLITIKRTYAKIDREKRSVLIKYLLAGVVPLFVSSSYLINANFALSFGVLLLLKRSSSLRRTTK